MIANGNLADWATYNETYGMPTRLGRYPANADAGQKADLEAALESLGSDGYGMFEEGWEIDFKENSSRASQPFGDLDERCKRAMSILYLGGNLTTDTTGGTGTFAAANVHDRVRGDIQADDAQREARTIHEQLLRPMVEFRYPGQNLPVPRFVRQFATVSDLVQEATKLTVATQQLGLKVGTRHVYETLEIPEPESGEPTIERIPQAGGMPAFGAPP
jgi:phage gp29-like protein